MLVDKYKELHVMDGNIGTILILLLSRKMLLMFLEKNIERCMGILKIDKGLADACQV